jgi:hypothetical protein
MHSDMQVACTDKLKLGVCHGFPSLFPPSNNPVMFYSEFELKDWSDERLVFKEISHRRSIASYVASLALTGASTIASAGVLMPLTLPIGAFKAYKINSHKSKLGMIRAELQRRHLSPAKKRKHDLLVPVTVMLTVYTLTLGLADIIDVVPLDLQSLLDNGIETTAGVEQGVSTWHYTIIPTC